MSGYGMHKELNLSKSRYCRGLQCPKMLWLEKNRPELAESVGNEAVLTNGTRVGELAQGYFGGYEVVPFSMDKDSMCSATAGLMAAGAENICEASFAVDGLYCAVDILHKCGCGNGNSGNGSCGNGGCGNGDSGNGGCGNGGCGNGGSGKRCAGSGEAEVKAETEDLWDIVEVKSSAHISPVYLDDMAFQYYVLTRCGLKIRRVCILYIDTAYVFHEALELQKLFKLEDYTEVCRKRRKAVEENIASIRAYVDTETEPAREVGVACHTPYDCPFRTYCTGSLPEHSVFDIHGMGLERKYELYHQGILTFRDVLEKKPKMGGNQLMQVEYECCKKEPKIDVKQIREFLSGIRYPVYHLDFEAFQTAVPCFEGCRPYCQIAFQYSLHIEAADGTLEHREFLAKEGEDPRRALAESLCNNIPENAYCMAYNMSFERGRLKELAEFCPDLSAHLLAIAGNLHDLMIPFQKHYYYDRAMAGSYSIKHVLPALFPEDPELNYESLGGVHRGNEAAAAYATLAERTPEEIREIRAALLCYCGLDTYAMVKILEKLREVAGEK